MVGLCTETYLSVCGLVVRTGVRPGWAHMSTLPRESESGSILPPPSKPRLLSLNGGRGRMGGEWQVILSGTINNPFSLPSSALL